MSVFTDVEDFHIVFRQDAFKPITKERLEFRHNLLREEYKEVQAEYNNALTKNKEIDNINKQNLSKELCDLIYVAVGMGVTFGLPLEEVWNRTHKSNMSKNGGVREDGKVLKGEGYEPPVLRDLFDE